MTTAELRALLEKTLEDFHMSRGERRALLATIRDLDLSPERLGVLRATAFDLARERGAAESLDWLEELVKVLGRAGAPKPEKTRFEAHFSPGETCRRRIISLLETVRRQVDICVFTITDDPISRAIIDAHRRGVALRVISDDEKAHDRGSDIAKLTRADVPVREDQSPFHMHHKFALFDEHTLLTGSYNWTRGAARDNEENIVITDEPSLVKPFAEQFETLWTQFA